MAIVPFAAAQYVGLLACLALTILSVKLWVVDIGINRVWKTFGEEYGLASGPGVNFGLEWYCQLGVSQAEDDEFEDFVEEDGGGSEISRSVHDGHYS